MQHLHPITLAQDFANVEHVLRDRFEDRTISIRVEIITLSSEGEHVARYSRETRYSYETGVIAHQPGSTSVDR